MEQSVAETNLNSIVGDDVRFYQFLCFAKKLVGEDCYIGEPANPSYNPITLFLRENWHWDCVVGEFVVADGVKYPIPEWVKKFHIRENNHEGQKYTVGEALLWIELNRDWVAHRKKALHNLEEDME